MHFKYDHNLLLLWFFLIFQVVILVSYLIGSSTWTNDTSEKADKLAEPIKFVQGPQKDFVKKLNVYKYRTYYNSDIDYELYLKTDNVMDYFITINDTICFKFGTDIGYMKRNFQEKNEKCECLPGYHGNDCSLPEVIWRAFIAFRQETVLHRRNVKARRVIHLFKINYSAQIQLAIIKINELFDVVDLFIVAESNSTEYGETKPFYFKQKLDKGLLSDKQYKILFTPLYESKRNAESQSRINENIWRKSQKIIKNLRDDDIFVELESYEIPNSKALLFFKLYDKFSLPLQFRLKWNVYGYYFQHPNKTKKVTSATTIRMFEEVYKSNPDAIKNDEGLVVGDLNHYGGWFCDLCYDIKDILNVIQTMPEFENIISESDKVIDTKYLEEIIGDGLYVDGKTLLIQNHEDRDPYYSPQYVSTNYWKFDSLMINFLNKLDYN